jgi:hypothetical protein
MSRRVRALWLQALTVTLAAEATLSQVTRSGYQPWTVPLDWHVFHSHHPLQFYLPWLAVLPFVATAGTLWSRRQGGSTRESLVVALFPAIAALGLTLVATPADILVDVIIQRNHPLEHTFCGTAWVLVSFVLAPGLALGVGFLGVVLWGRPAPRPGARAGRMEAGRV